MVTIRPHLLVHRVDIQRHDVVQDSRGSSLENWSTLVTDVPARVQPLSESRIPPSQSREGANTFHRVYTGPLPIAPRPNEFRLVFRGRILSILEARDVDELNAFWTIDCVEERHD